MSTNTAAVVNGSDRRIDHERFDRACTEDMAVETLAPGMSLVESNNETYTVDLRSGACDCPDQQYRHKICKHSVKAALVAIYTEGVTSEFVARVARHAAVYGCVAGESGCAGPTKIGERGFPCPECVVADEWDVWSRLVGGERQ